MIRPFARSALALGLAGAFAAFCPAFAADKSWEFEVVNKGNSPVIEFRTQEEGEWSENWVSSRIEPGDKVTLDFETDEGKCTVRTQIRFIDGTYFDADVDYCKANLLEIFPDTLVWKAAE
ncbi:MULTISPECIES: hypothetical protein [Hyphomicrobium]|jgi:hypothetical protein|uniref:hypothetical protein n=1 Tax=Hyphomicrobium TaxID=81 RepID=UPI00037115AD|nr:MULTISPECIES: hypothetical protein [Hyphomicrobium]WBT36900.1 hypothetical protein PE058_14700 [Hyphomicrobium sp. DMF-1]HML42007.1 hypothetical protein [Hyphomicrobium zavarzinii]